jgi:hypothetical protein
VPVTSCLIEDPRADAIIQTIVAMIPRYKLRIYNENTHRGFLRHVLVRTGHVTGQILVVLVATAAEFPGGKAFVQELTGKHPEITSVVLNVNQRETSMVLGQRDIPLYGPGCMEDVLCGKRFRISPQSFYQVNARQTEILYRTDPAANRKGDKNAFCNPADHIHDRVPSIRGSCYIQKNQFICSGVIVGLPDLDRVSGILQVHEINALDDPAVLHVQTGDDSFCKHL